MKSTIRDFIHDIRAIAGDLADDLETMLSHIEQLEADAAEHERLMGDLNGILHPDDDGPSRPSTCDLVAFVRKLRDDYNDAMNSIHGG